jgi:predicted DNA-binding transcriptional regulator YafY
MKIPTAERLINLSVFLLNERNPQILRDLIEQVDGYEKDKDYESNRRMFIRDKKALAELGITIRIGKTTDPRTGIETDAYTISPMDFYLPAISFGEEEANALSALENLFSGAGSESVLGDLDWAVAKVTATHGVPRHGGGFSDNVLLHLERGGGTVDPDLLEALRDSIAERHRLKTIYHSPVSGKTSKREIDPYGMFLRRGFWYLYGFCRLRNEERTFRVDRLKLLDRQKVEGRDFEPPEDFSLSEKLKLRAPWEYGDDETTTATIRFHPETFWQARNAWGDLPSAKFDEKQHTMTLKSVNDNGLIGWTLGFADGAEILSPPTLRTKMARILKGIARNAGNSD